MYAKIQIDACELVITEDCVITVSAPGSRIVMDYSDAEVVAANEAAIEWLNRFIAGKCPGQV